MFCFNYLHLSSLQKTPQILYHLLVYRKTAMLILPVVPRVGRNLLWSALEIISGNMISFLIKVRSEAYL